jgi:cytochrome c oxidase subunit 4
MTHHEHHAHEHVVPLRTNLIVFAALMGLLVLTVAVAFLDLGAVGLAIAMAIATIKAVLIILYFMHVRYGGRLQWIFASAAFFWLAILILITMSDYATRGWPGIAGK